MSDVPVHRPASFAEAVLELGQLGEEARVVAGGTDLLTRVRRGAAPPAVWLDISRVEEGRAIWEEPDWLHIGALVDFEALGRSPEVARTLPALAQAAGIMGSVQIRTRGTLGGNLANASPAADSVPPLVVGDARVVVLSPRGSREIPVAELATGPGRTQLQHDELVTAVRVPRVPGRRSAYHRVGTRAWHVITKASGALSCGVDRDGTLWDVRLALGAVAPTVVRAPLAEALLEGRVPSEEVLRQAGEGAAADARPIDDLRSTAAYRREMCQELVRILVAQLVAG